jgi:ubiquinone/menaquinone biosynthesis C-methylase UbiE
MAGDADQPQAEGTGRFFGNAAAITFLSVQTAEREAAFFLPSLRTGMRVLDVGCGPGTITVGLAAAVASGEVVGIDREDRPLEQARALAAERGVGNARFELADLHALPFSDGSFDAAFLHGVLEHVPDPVAALRAITRVVRPGGVVAARSPDITVCCLYPPDPLLETALSVFARFRARIGGHADIGRALRSVFRDAGLSDVVMSMSMESFGTMEGTRAWARLWEGYIGQPAIADQVVGFGLATGEQLDQMQAAWRAWADLPTSLIAFPWGEAIGYVQ